MQKHKATTFPPRSPHPFVGFATEPDIRIFAEPPGREADEELGLQWIQLSDPARVDVSNSATKALKSLGLPLELQHDIDKVDGSV